MKNLKVNNLSSEESVKFKMQLIHYGASQYDPTKFKTIKNRVSGLRCKPKGGLWTSPVDSEYGWKQWVIYEMPDWNVEDYFIVTLKESFRVLTIDSLEDLEEALKVYFLVSDFMGNSLDYERIAEDYDAIHLTVQGQESTRDDLYGWDVETVLILNTQCIDV